MNGAPINPFFDKDVDGVMCEVRHLPLCRGTISMNHSYGLTVLAAAAFVYLTNGAEASPHLTTPAYSPLSLQVGSKCRLVNGQLVCGNKKSSSKHNDHDDHHSKGAMQLAGSGVRFAARTPTRAGHRQNLGGSAVGRRIAGTIAEVVDVRFGSLASACADQPVVRRVDNGQS
jgi:hypothetical protein